MSLNELREAITVIDEEILDALKRRNELLPAVAKYKANHDIPVTIGAREEQMLEDYTHLANKYGLNPEFIKRLYKEIFTESRRIQIAMMKKSE